MSSIQKQLRVEPINDNYLFELNTKLNNNIRRSENRTHKKQKIYMKFSDDKYLENVSISISVLDDAWGREVD